MSYSYFELDPDSHLRPCILRFDGSRVAVGLVGAVAGMHYRFLEAECHPGSKARIHASAVPKERARFERAAGVPRCQPKGRV